MINIELPYPPSLNHLYPTARNGRRVISARGKKYKADVFALVKMNKIKKISGKLKVEIQAFVPDNRRRDLDNIVKITFDSLGDADVFDDDSQIDDFRVIRMPKIKGGKVIVAIQNIGV